MAVFLVPTLALRRHDGRPAVFRDRRPARPGVPLGDHAAANSFRRSCCFLFLLHALVGYVELGTDSWIINITGPIWPTRNYGLCVYLDVKVLMFVLRFFAGPIVHKISPLGLLFVSAVLGCAGLLLAGHPATIHNVRAGRYRLWLWQDHSLADNAGRGFRELSQGRRPDARHIGGVGVLSAGLLGGPGIGYKQDYFAISEA